LTKLPFSLVLTLGSITGEPNLDFPFLAALNNALAEIFLERPRLNNGILIEAKSGGSSLSSKTPGPFLEGEIISEGQVLFFISWIVVDKEEEEFVRRAFLVSLVLYGVFLACLLVE
jgi:hypothetical protein